MKTSRFTEMEILDAVKQAEAGIPAPEISRKYGVTRATIYRWRKQYGGMNQSELQRLKQLESENKKLKQIVADLSLDKHMLQKILRKEV